MQKLKFKKGYFGGNMEALEAERRGYQILVSDCFGNIPREGADWSFSFYKKNPSGDYDDNPCYTSDTMNNYNEKEAEAFMRKTLQNFLNLN